MNEIKYIECPAEFRPTLKSQSIFMAGGITGCPDWQSQIADAYNLRRIEFAPISCPYTLINPRRKNWQEFGDQSSKDQIEWEYRHLNLADHIFFWFPKEGKCMITLFEFGWALGSGKSIRIGVEPGYHRELDVIEQVKHRAPWMKIDISLESLYNDIIGSNCERQFR